MIAFGYDYRGNPIAEKITCDKKTGIYTTKQKFKEAWITPGIHINKIAITDNLYPDFFPEKVDIDD